jgi:mycoredoxin
VKSVKVYGADWRPMTDMSVSGGLRRAAPSLISHLRSLGVPFEYVNIEENPRAAEWVKAQNGGKEKKPTIDIEGRILAEPTNEELDASLA